MMTIFLILYYRNLSILLPGKGFIIDTDILIYSLKNNKKVVEDIVPGELFSYKMKSR
jgi:hypothetical protein